MLPFPLQKTRADRTAMYGDGSIMLWADLREGGRSQIEANHRREAAKVTLNHLHYIRLLLMSDYFNSDLFKHQSKNSQTTNASTLQSILLISA